MFATRRSLLRVLEREREAHIAERRLLLEQLCHLAGKPWTQAPSRHAPQVAEVDEFEQVFQPVGDPDQDPDY